jgi:aldehyde:ferredoxin oxidoreductase
MSKVLRIDMNDLSYRFEETPQPYKALGGRALTSRIVSDEVPALCNPLGSANKLVIAPGLLGGTKVPCSGRLSIGAKSPLTGGIKESNAGGTSAIRLAQTGLKALVLEGQPQGNSLYIIVIEGEKVEFVDARQYSGRGNYPLAASLREEYGDAAALITNGPAGEMEFVTASIANVDPEGRPSRVNGRGGLGAVMGSKGIKAVVIKPSQQNPTTLCDPERFSACVKDIANTIIDHPGTQIFKDYGTAVLVKVTNDMGCLPTRNFSSGSFSGAGNISGQSLREMILARGGKGKTTHACMPGCIIRCSNVVPGSDGEELVAPIEYETIGLMGSNCGIDNLDDIARLNYLANDLGIDTMETGAALAVAMEHGNIAWGDAEGAALALRGMIKGELLGRLLGCGAVVTGKVLGINRVPAVKGQSIAAYDPRALKGLGVTYATSPMGADHTAGSTLRAPVDHLNAEGQAEASKNSQLNVLVFDMLGLCMFTMTSLLGNPAQLGDLVGAYQGSETTFPDLLDIARSTLRLEREFNRKAGITVDMLPEYFRTEPLSPKGSVFDVPQDQLDQLFVE